MACAQGRDEYLRAFEARAEHIQMVYDTSRAPGIYGAAVLYTLGRDIRKADSLLLASDQVRRPSGDMFWMVPVIGTYLRGKDKMSAAARDAVRNLWKTYTPYRGDTENHWCMYYASLFLAAEQFPGLPPSEWYNGKSSDENREEAKEYINRWIEITTTIGQGEFDSPNYLPEFMMPMLLLAEFAGDPEMKKKASMMADYLLADFAVDHLAGMYLGGNSREAPAAVWKPLLAPASDFAWLYFGTGDEKHSGWIVLPALSSYRLPQIIYNIATDRSAAYISKKRKRVRNVIRYGKEKNPPVYKYSYVTSEYGLSSLQGGILQPIQQHTWSVRFTASKPTSTVFGLHPYWSGEELAMFFPEEKKVLIADVVASKGTYNKDTKWTSSSPYEQVFQHRNTLIALYNIPPGTTSEHIDGFFPKALDERILDGSGWILCRAGETYIGWYPLQSTEWLHLKEDEDNWRLRSYGLQNGYVVEVRSKKEAGSFGSFCAKLATHIPQKLYVKGLMKVRYRTLRGELMSSVFGGPNELNGKALSHKHDRLFDSPFLSADVGSGTLTIRYKNSRRILDFTSLSVKE